MRAVHSFNNVCGCARLSSCNIRPRRTTNTHRNRNDTHPPTHERTHAHVLGIYHFFHISHADFTGKAISLYASAHAVLWVRTCFQTPPPSFHSDAAPAAPAARAGTRTNVLALPPVSLSRRHPSYVVCGGRKRVLKSTAI